MPKMARGRGTGASHSRPASGKDWPSAGLRSPDAKRSRTVPSEKAMTSSPRTSPARTAPEPGSRKGTSRMDAAWWHTTALQPLPAMADDVGVEARAIDAAAAASAASYRSFADATRSVLDLLEQQIPGVAIFLAHIDRSND